MELETEERRNYSMILIRVVMGLIFLLEGSLKFLRPDNLGSGRFEALGVPLPHYLAPLVGGIEIVGGAAILVNIYAGDAAFAMLVVVIAALIATKFPILLGRPLGPFPLEVLKDYGWLSFFHQARLEFCQVFCLLAIVIDSGLKVGKKRRWYQTGPN
ncbi:MAG: DoxX family protein [Terracidiphilus sp.]|jgi:uncharacterized membrane protein YphA (DoxX/SURF4 family)